MTYADGGGPSFVSTGALPASGAVSALVSEAYELYRHNEDGENSRVYPALERVPSELFGLAVVGTDGSIWAAGDADVEFSIMSVSKPFVFALVCDALGPDAAREHVGANATGMAFDSIDAIDQRGDGRTNPMVNAGAIATTSLVPGGTIDARWQFIVDGLSRFAGHPLAIDDEIYASASASNHRNREIVAALQRHGRIVGDPSAALDLYTRQCSLRVTATDLAMMGSTLADGGVHPVSGIRVVEAVSCRCALAVMTTAGLYETSGDWLYDIGLPGKSGIGGGIVTVAPGKGGLGTFAPRLDDAGNSVKGQLAARHLSDRLGLDLLRSAPAPRPAADPRPV